MTALDAAMEVDYSVSVEEQLPKCKELAKQGQLQKALDKLLTLEKQTRLSADTSSCGKVLVAIVQLCYDSQQWALLNQQLINMAKKRNLLKLAISKMIQEAVTFVEDTPDMATKLELINTLRNVTEGKIYVENERARLTLKLCNIHEDKGDITSASAVLQELQVETYGSMERQEKTEFILQQMRLSLAKQDYIRTQIISKKINTRFFTGEEPAVQQLKIRFYKLMIELSEHDTEYLKTCQHYRQIYDTECVKGDEGWWKEILKLSCIYVLLSPYFNDQSDLMHRILKDKQLEQLPEYRDILTLFTKLELIYWADFVNQYQALLRDGTDACPHVKVFNYSEAGEEMWRVLHRRITEHNIRVMSKHYTRISFDRMTHLLSLPLESAEEITSHLVVNKTIYARIDRSKGVVSFRKPLETHQYLSDWSHNIENLMGFVSKSVHLVNKEEMIHKLK